MAARGAHGARRFRRRTVRVLVDCVTPDMILCEYATTLGAGGLFLETEQPLAAGTQLKLRFRLPGGSRIYELEGRVVWRQQAGGPGAARAPGVGIEFVDPAATAELGRELDTLP
jgi:uncharacterized protein (TIGR02266 family)